MQPNYFFLLGLLVGDAAVLLWQFSIQRQPGERFNWGYVPESWLHLAVAAAGGELAYNSSPFDPNPGSQIVMGLLAGAVARYKGGEDARADRKREEP